MQLIFGFEPAVIGGTGSLGNIGGRYRSGPRSNLRRPPSSPGLLASRPWRIPLGSRWTLVFFGALSSRSPQTKIWVTSVDAHSNLSIQRWTNLTLAVAIVVAVLFVLLAVGPAFLPGNILDKLTVLFIYVCLAAMWNALAGYGGMISAGQQAFFGLGGYLAIRLSEWGAWPYPALIAAALLAGLSALPISAIVLRLRAGEFAIGMWIIAECVQLLVNLDPIIQGDTGRSLIALSAIDAAERRIFTYWLALASMGVMLGLIFLLLRSRLGSSIQAIRDNEEAAASVGKSVGRQTHNFRDRRNRLRARWRALVGHVSTFQPRSFFGIQWSAYMIFMVLVGGIGRFEGPILGAIIFFVIETWLGRLVYGTSSCSASPPYSSRYSCPRALGALSRSRFQVLLLPVGYRVQTSASSPIASPSERSLSDSILKYVNFTSIDGGLAYS